MRIFIAAVAAFVALVLLVPVMLVVLPFWLVSLLTRIIARVIEPEFLTREGLIQYDPVFGWRARPNLDTHHLMVDLFHIRTDRDGWRGNYTLAESDIVVFGDSFAAGYGVSDHHFFGNLKSPYKIKSVAIGGYSMVQELLWMEHLKNSLRGKLVVWFIYYGNDLYDNLMPDLRGYRKPFLREDKKTGEWEIVSSHVTAQRWPIVSQVRMQGENHLPALADICSDTFLAKRAYSACECLIGRAKSLCRETDADLVVVSIPDARQLTPQGQRELENRSSDPTSFNPDLADSRIAETCRALEVEFRAGRTFLDANCYKTNDCHWNEKGHRAVAEMLGKICRDRQCEHLTRKADDGKLVAQA